MHHLRLLLSCVIGTFAILSGCRSTPTPAPSPTTSESQDPAEKPLPRPEEALAYIQAALKDKSRLIEVFNDRGMDGALDSSGRSKLREAVKIWWKQVDVQSRFPKAGEVPFRVTPDMGIGIYAPGSAPAAQAKSAAPIGKPDLRIMIYKARQLSRVVITDSTAGRLNDAVFIIPSTEPMDWVNRLFAGKL